MLYRNNVKQTTISPFLSVLRLSSRAYFYLILPTWEVGGRRLVLLDIHDITRLDEGGVVAWPPFEEHVE